MQTLTSGVASVFSVVVNESGASVSSASEIARQEFPDLDLTVRGAISHLEKAPLDLSEVKASTVGCDPAAAAGHDIQLPLAAMSARTLPPQETEFGVTVPREAIGGDCVVQIAVFGHAATGEPVEFHMNASVGTIKPTIVMRSDDPAGAAQLARLQKAAKLLGKDLTVPGTVITQPELDRLIVEGRLEPEQKPPQPERPADAP